MKFLKENWYKLMIGFSMVTFSISALIYTISPAMANESKAKAPVISNGVLNGDYMYFTDGGYLYEIDRDNFAGYSNRWWNGGSYSTPKKKKLP
jgi:hypothetical protein